jgi:hypothetical protein
MRSAESLQSPYPRGFVVSTSISDLELRAHTCDIRVSALPCVRGFHLRRARAYACLWALAGAGEKGGRYCGRVARLVVWGAEGRRYLWTSATNDFVWLPFIPMRRSVGMVKTVENGVLVLSSSKYVIASPV